MKEMTASFFGDAYRSKRVLVTGHTGFKGSWLCLWLSKLGAKVYGYSKGIPTRPSHYELLNLKSKVTSYFGDVTDLPRLKEAIEDMRPDFVFHLAAQSVVSESYRDPLGTLSTNLMGTANVLQTLKDIPCKLVVITSDKCYLNREWVYGYRETDTLGGKDIYSVSKACSELVYASFFESFFKSSAIRSATARAGNVIGGGDFTKDRIIPDIVRSWSAGVPVSIRSPHATRPWQFVLEPLSGYLHLAIRLDESRLNGHSFNFGPRQRQAETVVKVLQTMQKYWRNNAGFKVVASDMMEANLLKLNCDKAFEDLNWEPNLTYEETVRFTTQWYHEYRSTGSVISVQQIEDYQNLAIRRGLAWVSK